MLRLLSIFLSLGVIFSIIAFYMLVNTTPIDETKIEAIIEQEQIGEEEEEVLWSIMEEKREEGLIFEYVTNEVYIVTTLFSLSALFFLVSIHMVVDKLAFKKYYESANLLHAFRRAIVVVSAVLLYYYLFLIKTEWYIYVFAPLLLLVVEVSFSLMQIQQKKSKELTPPDSLQKEERV